MNYIREFLTGKKGVSPVIGVIMMVAITVVMAAVIAGYAYGYIGNSPKTPNVALSVIDDPNNADHLLIKHSGGENIGAGEWKCSITDGKESETDFTTQTGTGDQALSTGTVLSMATQTDTGTTEIAAGWYHFVAVHVGSDAILLDTNVLVR